MLCFFFSRWLSNIAHCYKPQAVSKWALEETLLKLLPSWDTSIYFWAALWQFNYHTFNYTPYLQSLPTTLPFLPGSWNSVNATGRLWSPHRCSSSAQHCMSMLYSHFSAVAVSRTCIPLPVRHNWTELLKCSQTSGIPKLFDQSATVSRIGKIWNIKFQEIQ